MDQRDGQVRTQKESDKPWALTLWGTQKEEQVMMRKRKLFSQRNSLPGDHKGRDESEHEKKATE